MRLAESTVPSKEFRPCGASSASEGRGGDLQPHHPHRRVWDPPTPSRGRSLGTAPRRACGTVCRGRSPCLFCPSRPRALETDVIAAGWRRRRSKGDAGARRPRRHRRAPKTSRPRAVNGGRCCREPAARPHIIGARRRGARVHERGPTSAVGAAATFAQAGVSFRSISGRQGTAARNTRSDLAVSLPDDRSRDTEDATLFFSISV